MIFPSISHVIDWWTQIRKLSMSDSNSDISKYTDAGLNNYFKCNYYIEV